mgnify:CR=1 FL=1
MQTAVISNADDDVTIVCTHFAFAPLMDLIVTSALVGYDGRSRGGLAVLKAKLAKHRR